MDALHLVVDWPVDHVAAAVITPNGDVIAIGDQERRYRLASLTKPMTAWAVLIGVEEGVLDLDEVPPGAQAGCTLRHLLSHAGGYPFEGSSPVEAPGSSRIYSNTGFEIAAGALAKAAGFGFDDYLAEAVFEPLGMSTCTLDGSPAQGVTGSCADVVRFASELLHTRLLAPDTADDARRPQFPELSGIVPGVGRFEPCPWGLGVEIAGSKEPHWTGRVRSAAAVGHFGGAGTMMWADPRAHTALVALTDRPFDQWAAEALRSWAALSDAVLDELAAAGLGAGAR